MRSVSGSWVGLQAARERAFDIPPFAAFHDAKWFFLQLTSRREVTHVVHAQNHRIAERSRGAAGSCEPDPYCNKAFRKRPPGAAALSRRSRAGGVRARLFLGRGA